MTYNPTGLTRNDHRAFAFEHRHSSDQTEYIEKANKTIQLLSKIISKHLKDSTSDPFLLFDNCIKIASNSRRNIAQKIEQRNCLSQHKVYIPDSCEFGRPRLEENPNTYNLLLGGAYVEYAQKTAVSVISELELSEEEKLSPKQKQAFVKELSSSAKIRIWTDWEFIEEKDTCNKVLSISRYLLSDIKFKKSLDDFKASAKALGAYADIKKVGEKIVSDAHKTILDLKHRNPTLYNQNLTLCLIEDLKQHISELSSVRLEHIRSFENRRFAIGTLFYSMNDQPSKVLTKYICYLIKNEEASDAQYFLNFLRSPMILLGHQDVTDIEDTLKDAGILFCEALNWTSEMGEDSLKEKVGMLMYLLAHNHRDIRGTAAESEWIERAIFQAHGFTVCCEPERMPDLLAFSNIDLEAFLQEYAQSFSLQANSI